MTWNWVTFQLKIMGYNKKKSYLKRIIVGGLWRMVLERVTALTFKSTYVHKVYVLIRGGQNTLYFELRSS